MVLHLCLLLQHTWSNTKILGLMVSCKCGLPHTPVYSQFFLVQGVTAGDLWKASSRLLGLSIAASYVICVFVMEQLKWTSAFYFKLGNGPQKHARCLLLFICSYIMHTSLNSVKDSEKAVMSLKMVEWEAAINCLKYGNFCRCLWTDSHRLSAYPKIDGGWTAH